MGDRDKTEIINQGRGMGAQANTDDAVTRITGRGESIVGHLAIIDGPGKGASLPVFQGQNDISRSDTARIKLDFGDLTISRNAPMLLECDPKAKSYVLRDNGHPNPVTVNGTRLNGVHSLADGDRIAIGKTTLRFTLL